MPRARAACLDAVAELFTSHVKRLDHRLVAVGRHRGDPRGEADVLRAVRRGQEEDTLAIVV